MTVKLTLHRLTFSTDHPTHGVLVRDNTPICATLERPWKNNVSNVSCIPAGTYKCIPHHSEKFHNTWEITGVRDREAILFHAGNAIQDTHGCILVGQYFSCDMLMISRLTMEKLRNELPPEFILELINP